MSQQELYLRLPNKKLVKVDISPVVFGHRGCIKIQAQNGPIYLEVLGDRRIINQLAAYIEQQTRCVTVAQIAPQTVQNGQDSPLQLALDGYDSD